MRLTTESLTSTFGACAGLISPRLETRINKLILKSPGVLRYHAVIQHGKGGVWIYDLGSTHRTFVNDHKQPLVNDGLLPIHQYKQILMYDIVMFGNCELFYRLEGGPTRQEFEHSKG